MWVRGGEGVTTDHCIRRPAPPRGPRGGVGVQVLLFSATLPGALLQFTRAGLHDPALVRLDTETKVSDKLKVRGEGARLGLADCWRRADRVGCV